MTEQSWNKEQIEAAVGAALRDPQKTMSLYDYIIAELTKPAPVFKVGEVIYGNVRGFVFYRNSFDLVHDENFRHLTPEEVPALALALEMLEYIRSHVEHDEHIEEVAQTALNDIKAML